MRKIYIIQFLFIFLFGINECHAQYENGINIGAYCLNFSNNKNEAMITIELPEEFTNNFIGWSPSSWPTTRYGVTGFSIPPMMISRYNFLGSEIKLWVTPQSWDGEKRIQLIIDTNKPSHFSI